MARHAFRRIRLDALRPPALPIRSRRKKLDELTESVASVGVLVPLLVREIGDGAYMVVAGAGRLEALTRAGTKPSSLVPCVVVEADDAEAVLLSLVENLVRENMEPLDEAEIAALLLREHGYSQQRVADALGRSQSSLSRM